MSEATGWTAVGVAALIFLAVVLFGAQGCLAKGAAAKAEACRAVMTSGDERARLLAVGMGGVCSGQF